MLPPVAQTFEEKVIAALSSIEATLGNLDKTVNAESGGLVAKFIELEKKVLTLETKLQAKDSVLWRILMIGAWVATTAIALYNLVSNVKQ